MAAHPANGRKVLVVIGMHRSGTSATTGALQCLGVNLGERLYAGHQGINDKGYFEHSDIADTDDEVLWQTGSCWDDILLKQDGWWENEDLGRFEEKMRHFIRRDFPSDDLWALKDPRVCRLLPWWLRILNAEKILPHFLFVVRPAEAVYRSLEKRDGFSRDKAYLLWLLHYLEAERWSRDYPRGVLGFDRFLHDPVGEFCRIEKELGSIFPIPAAQASECLGRFVSPGLRHHRDNHDAIDRQNPLHRMAHDLEACLMAAADGGGAPPDAGEMDRLREAMAQYQREHFSGPLREHLLSVSRQRGGAQLTLNRIFRSWSWVPGKPIRFAERSIFKRDV